MYIAICITLFHSEHKHELYILVYIYIFKWMITEKNIIHYTKHVDLNYEKKPFLWKIINKPTHNNYNFIRIITNTILQQILNNSVFDKSNK